MSPHITRQGRREASSEPDFPRKTTFGLAVSTALLGLAYCVGEEEEGPTRSPTFSSEEELVAISSLGGDTAEGDGTAEIRRIVDQEESRSRHFPGDPHLALSQLQIHDVTTNEPISGSQVAWVELSPFLDAVPRLVWGEFLEGLSVQEADEQGEVALTGRSLVEKPEGILVWAEGYVPQLAVVEEPQLRSADIFLEPLIPVHFHVTPSLALKRGALNVSLHPLELTSSGLLLRPAAVLEEVTGYAVQQQTGLSLFSLSLPVSDYEIRAENVNDPTTSLPCVAPGRYFEVVARRDGNPTTLHFERRQIHPGESINIVLAHEILLELQTEIRDGVFRMQLYSEGKDGKRGSRSGGSLQSFSGNISLSVDPQRYDGIRITLRDRLPQENGEIRYAEVELVKADLPERVLAGEEPYRERVSLKKALQITGCHHDGSSSLHAVHIFTEGDLGFHSTSSVDEVGVFLMRDVLYICRPRERMAVYDESIGQAAQVRFLNAHQGEVQFQQFSAVQVEHFSALLREMEGQLQEAGLSDLDIGCSFSRQTTLDGLLSQPIWSMSFSHQLFGNSALTPALVSGTSALELPALPSEALRVSFHRFGGPQKSVQYEIPGLGAERAFPVRAESIFRVLLAPEEFRLLQKD
ncbi:hypothetical protein MRY87_06475 [bacterium]|nr:hypothetical protein [bacterium]